MLAHRIVSYLTVSYRIVWCRAMTYRIASLTVSYRVDTAAIRSIDSHRSWLQVVGRCLLSSLLWLKVGLPQTGFAWSAFRGLRGVRPLRALPWAAEISSRGACVRGLSFPLQPRLRYRSFEQSLSLESPQRGQACPRWWCTAPLHAQALV